MLSVSGWGRLYTSLLRLGNISSLQKIHVMKMNVGMKQMSSDIIMVDHFNKYFYELINCYAN